MRRNEEDEDLLRIIHQDIQQLLEKRFLNSLDSDTHFSTDLKLIQHVFIGYRAQFLRKTEMLVAE